MDTASLSSWSYDHYVAFLLLYAAYADLEFSSGERQLILHHVSQQKLTEAESHFDQLGDFEQLNLLMELSKVYITSSEEKLKIRELLKDLWNSDGEVTQLETNLSAFLDKLLHLQD